jgi:hypothetical protein
MNIITQASIEFFYRELLQETNDQIRIFEAQPTSNYPEMGRIRLYEERAKIHKHFELCDKTIALFLTNHLHQALVGRVETKNHCHSLTWEEQESMRHSLETELHTDIIWEKDSKPPKVSLTSNGTVTKKFSSL